MNTLKRILSVALVLALVLVAAPMQLLAEATSSTATISFADVANRTELSTTKQVWEQNGITVTNEKTATSSDIVDYSNPARFYKYSKLTIAYPGMKQLVVTCKYADNAQALQTVADAMDGVTATVSDTVVTITLDAAANSLVIESLSAGKVFVNEITVYTDGSVPDVPETPEEPEEPEEPETVEIVDIATALAGAEGATFAVKGVVTVVDSSNYYVQDATGAICVRLATNTTEIALGDTIIGTGTRATYNGLPQLGSATFEKSSGLTLEAKETTIDALTTADICTYVTIKGLTITEMFDNNGQYTNPNVTVEDTNGNSIQIYKAAVAKDGDAWAFQVGDVIDFTGAVSCYKETLQLRNTLTSEIVLADAAPGEETDTADFNGDGELTDADAIYLLRHTLFPEQFAVSGNADCNGDGEVTDADAIYLLRHTLFPEQFPLMFKKK